MAGWGAALPAEEAGRVRDPSVEEQIGRVELGELFQLVPVEDPHQTLPELDQTAFAQLPQHAVGVHRGQAAGIRQIDLRHREIVILPVRHAAPLEPHEHFAEQMREPHRCVLIDANNDADNVAAAIWAALTERVLSKQVENISA